MYFVLNLSKCTVFSHLKNLEMITITKVYVECNDRHLKVVMEARESGHLPISSDLEKCDKDSLVVAHNNQ